MLLDTGASSSMISVGKARELGVDVADDGSFRNIPADRQFSLPIGGIGGMKTVHGFYVDVLELPASRGEDIRYLKAPVLVLDISVKDAVTGEPHTLDGVFGMNYLVASASITADFVGAGVGDIHDGAFKFIVVDHKAGTLCLAVK
jgi:hypothetical protein